MTWDKMTWDKMTWDKMTWDKMTWDKMTSQMNFRQNGLYTMIETKWLFTNLFESK